MTREEAIWWVNHLFEIRKEEYFNKGMLQDAREVDEARQIVIYALSNNVTESPNEAIKRQNDVIDVVRCKDCIRNNDGNLCNVAYFINTDGDGFCNCGERREP